MGCADFRGGVKADRSENKEVVEGCAEFGGQDEFVGI